MNDLETTRRLDALRYLDQETVRVYDAVLRHVTGDEAAQLKRFRDDHERHVTALTDLARKAERLVGDPSQVFKSFVDEHLRVARQSRDVDEAMETLLLAERAALAEYDTTRESQLPDDIARVVEQHTADERRHVEWAQRRAPVAVLSGAGERSTGAASDVSCLSGGMIDDVSPDDFE